MSVLNRDKILEAARQFVEQGKVDRAIKEYEKLIQADPQDMRVRLRLAELFVKRKQVVEAIRAYQEVADNYTQGGFFLKAVTVYKNILRLNPSLLEVNHALAELYEKMGLATDAVHQYEILANSYEQKAMFVEELEIRKKMVELDLRNADHRIRYAEVLQREGKQEEAITQYAILAKQYAKEGGREEYLMDLYEKVLPHHSEDVEMLRSLVNIYYQKGEVKDALRWLEKSKRIVLDQEDLLKLQAGIYGQLNQLETARSHYQQLAELYLNRNETEKALDAYCEIITLLPEESANLQPVVDSIQAGAFERLVKVAGDKRRKRDEAEVENERKREEKKIESAPEKKSTSVKVGKIAPSGPVGDAVDLLKQARSSLHLAKVYQETGLENEADQEWAHAKSFLDSVLQQDPQNAEALNLLKQFSSPAKKEMIPEIKKETTPEPKKEIKKGKRNISFV